VELKGCKLIDMLGYIRLGWEVADSDMHISLKHNGIKYVGKKFYSSAAGKPKGTD
jgi:hypothetical protein